MSIDSIFRDFGLEYDKEGACPCGCDVFVLHIYNSGDTLSSECFDCGAERSLDFGMDEDELFVYGPYLEICPNCGHHNVGNFVEYCDNCEFEFVPF